jgi:hypothetical protein
MSNTTIKLELTLDEVNGIMVALGNLPYAQVMGLVEKIKLQAVPQVKQNETSSVEEPEEVAPA